MMGSKRDLRTSNISTVNGYYTQYSYNVKAPVLQHNIS